MGAELIIKDKRAVDGTITEVVVWRLSRPVSGCTHLFKYRFYFGLVDGTCIVRYDNERGKGGVIGTLAAERSLIRLQAFPNCSMISMLINQHGSPGETYYKKFQGRRYK